MHAAREVSGSTGISEIRLAVSIAINNILSTKPGKQLLAYIHRKA